MKHNINVGIAIYTLPEAVVIPLWLGRQILAYETGAHHVRMRSVLR
jgi:hypothetical protein